MNTRETELKPCPFCGEKPQVVPPQYDEQWPDDPPTHGGINCPNCCVFMPRHPIELAIEAWNRRAQ